MNKTTVALQAKTASLLPPVQGILHRKCACGSKTVGGCEFAECMKKKSSLAYNGNLPLVQVMTRWSRKPIELPIR